MFPLRPRIFLKSSVLVVLLVAGVGFAAADELPGTLEGQITTDPFMTDGGDTVVGTGSGVYVFDDEELQYYMAMPAPVSEVVHVDGAEFVVVLADTPFDNIRYVDVAEQEEYWSARTAADIYDEHVGETAVTLDVFDLQVTNDVAVVATATGVEGFDMADGDRAWSADIHEAVWTVTAHDGALFAGSQYGYLHRIDPGSGEIQFRERVVDPYESDDDDDIGPVARPIWDVESVGGADAVAVGGEDGYVYFVDPDTGDTDGSEDLIEYSIGVLDDYYEDRNHPTTRPSEPFFDNIELDAVDDITDDGADDLVAVTREEDVGGTLDEELHLVQSMTQNTDWMLPVDISGGIAYTPALHGGSVVVPESPGRTSQDVAVYNLETGLEEDTLEVPTAGGDQGGDGAAFAAGSDTHIAVVSDDGDMKLLDADGDLLWSFPRITDFEVESGEFRQGMEDYLVYDRYEDQRDTLHRTFMLRDGDDGSTVWTEHQNITAADESPIRDIEQIEPVTGSGTDIMLMAGPDHGPDGSDRPSIISVMDGSDGDILHNFVLQNTDGQFPQRSPDENISVASATVIGDAGGTGNNHALVTADDRLFAMDLRTGDIVGQRLFRHHGPQPEHRGDVEAEADEPKVLDWFDDWRPHVVAVGPGDRPDIAFIDDRNQNITRLEQDGTGDAFELTPRETAEVDRNIRDYSVIGDVTDDGYDELLVEKTDDDGTEHVIVSVRDGEVLFSSGELRQRIGVFSLEDDLTGNDQREIATLQRTDQGGGAEIALHSASTQIWGTTFHRFAGDIDTAQPVASAGDVTGDGSPELAVAKAHLDGEKRIDMYDVQADDVVDSITLQPETDWQQDDVTSLKYLQQIPDQTGDGTPELGVVVGDYIRDAVPDDDLSGFYIVDPQAGEVLVSGDGTPSSFIDIGDRTGVFGSNGGLTLVDVTDAVEIDPLDDTPELDLSWSFASDEIHDTTIEVNDRPVQQTTDTAITLRLPPGEHDITVRSTNEDEITVYDTAQVTVMDDSASDTLLFGATALLFVLIFLPNLLRRVRE